MMKLYSDKKIISLEIIRAVSAIFIVLYHYTTRCPVKYEINGWLFQIPLASLAVNVFLIISGFLTIYTYREQSAATFLANRAKRLYPVFWVSILVTCLYVGILMPEELRSFKEILLNFTMIPTLFGVNYVDGVYWTLLRELIFYFNFAVLIIAKQAKNLWAIQLPWMIITLCLPRFLYLIPNETVQSVIKMGSNLGYAYNFLIGVAIFYLVFGKRKREKVFSLLSLVFCFFILIKDSYKMFGVITLIFSVIIFAAVLLHRQGIRITEKISKWFAPLLFVAEISYPLYLTHQMTGYSIIKKIMQLGLSGEWIIVFPILNAVLLAFLIHRFVEIPVAEFFARRNTKKRIGK